MAVVDQLVVAVGAETAEARRKLEDLVGTVNRSATSINSHLGRVDGAMSRLSGVVGGVRGKFEELAAGAGVVGSVLSRLGPAGVAVAAALATVSTVLGRATADATAAQTAQLKLAAVLKATGSASGLTAREIGEMAESMERSTINSAEAISDAAAAMATFRSISGDTFKDAIGLAADMAATFGGDVRGAAVQLGKALEEPIEGLSSLRRVGVTFGEGQKALIARLVETGQKAEAQRIILKALEGQLGGAAAGQASGVAGASHRAAAATGDFFKQLADNLNLLDLTKRGLDSIAGAIDGVTGKMKELASPEYQLGQVDKRIEQIRRNPARGVGSATQGRELAGLLAERNRLQFDIDAATEAGVIDKFGTKLRGNQAQQQQADEAAAAKAREAAEAAAKAARERAGSFERIVASLERETQLAGLGTEERERTLTLLKAQDAVGGALTATEARRLDLALAANVAERERVKLLGDVSQFLKDSQAGRDSLDGYLGNLREEARLAGLSKEEQAEAKVLAEARLKLGYALNDAQKEELLAAQRLKTANETAMKAAEDRAKEFNQFWDRASERIGDSLGDALVAGFDRGQSGAELLFDAVKRMALQSIAEIASAAIFRPAAASVFGALGLGSGAAQAGTGGGGSLLSAAGNASSIFNLLPSSMTGGPMNLLGSAASGISGLFGGGGGAAGLAGLDAMAAGEFANFAAQGGGILGAGGGAAGLSAAVPYVGAALAAATLAYSVFGKKKPSVGPNGTGGVLLGDNGLYGAMTSGDNGFSGGQVVGFAGQAAQALSRLASQLGTSVTERGVGGFAELQGRLSFGFNGEGYGNATSSESAVADYVKAAVERGALAGVTQVDEALIAGAVEDKLGAVLGQRLAVSIDATLGQLEKLAQGAETLAARLGDSLDSLRIDGNLSPLKPLERLAEAQRQFSGVLAAGLGGDLDAAARTPQVGQALLGVTREAYARSSSEYRAAYGDVTGGIGELQQTAAGRASALRAGAGELASLRSEAMVATVVDRVDQLADQVARLVTQLRVQNS